MSMWTRRAVLLLALFAGAATAQDRYPGVGRPATPAEIAAWDIDVRADFTGLPKGSGTVSQGQDLWEKKCASCHGYFGESNEVFPPIIGGTKPEDVKRGRVASLIESNDQRTTMMKLSRISTLWDYIRRAMPWNEPKSLSVDEVYAVTAYILNLNDIIKDTSFELNQSNLASIKMPNRGGFYDDDRETTEKHFWGTKPCMKDCKAEAKVLNRARVLDVTPDAKTGPRVD